VPEEFLFCNFCGKKGNPVWSENNYEVLKCNSCGLIWLGKGRQSKDISLYDESYFNKWYIKHEDRRKQYFKLKIKEIEKMYPIDSFKSANKKVLDVGCGVGLFLEAAKENGWECYGLETSQFAADYSRKKLKIDVYSDDLLRASIPENCFDLITMWDVVAHVNDPKGYLLKIKQLLKPKGMLVIKTPDHPQVLFGLAKIISFFRQSKGLVHVPAQIYHFNVRSLKNNLEKLGYRVMKIEKTKEALRSNWTNSKIKNLIIHFSILLMKIFGVSESIIIYAVQKEQ